MTDLKTTQMVTCYYSGNKILQPSVIPAKAGIQYFLDAGSSPA